MLRIEQALIKVCQFPNPKKCPRGSLKGVYKKVAYEVWPISLGADFQLHMNTGPDDERDELKKIVLDAWNSS